MMFLKFRKAMALAICPELSVREASAIVACVEAVSGASALELSIDAASAPIWKSGRRPKWWHDLEVRHFLTASHRQMSILNAEREGVARFGKRCPKKSSIHDYWTRLDALKEPKSRRVA